jgi:Fic family protein
MFEKKLLFNFETTQKILQRISYIDTFKGKWSHFDKSDSRYLKELRQIATIESIGSSTRIEGATLTDEEVAELIKKVKVTSFQSRDEQEVIGYYDVLDLILENAKEVELSENHIKQLHSILLKYSSKDSRHRGQYKSLSNKVVANYPDGSQRIIFNTTEPILTPKEMSELIEWTDSQLVNKITHPLIVIGLWVYEFLSIHPFQDGNGRLSRLITTLLLIQNEYDFAQYISLEHIIEQRKTDYYQALMNAQQFRYSEQEIIADWMIFFLDCLKILIERLEAKMSQNLEKTHYLNIRQKEVLALFNENKPLKISDICLSLPSYSANTIKKDIQYLLNEGCIQKMGIGKATVYWLQEQNT